MKGQNPGAPEREAKMPCAHKAPKHPLFQASDYVTGDAFTIQQCPTCGMAFTLPAPTAEAMGRYYPEAYYGDPTHRRFPGLVEALQRGLYAYRVWRVGRQIQGSHRRVLDIGCGKGFLLDAFRRQGWLVQGVELSEHSARHGREILGLDIHIGPLTDPSMADQRFDAVVLWHVLEHAHDPGRLLSEVHRLLSPGGVLLVSVPNFGSPEARLSASGWFHLDVPRHLVHFTRDTLTGLLNRVDFEYMAQFRFAPEFDLFSFIQSFLNGMGLPQNQLYRMLRGQWAKLPGPKARWWHGPTSLGLALPLSLVGLVWIPVAGWLGFGSTLSYLVRKLERGDGE